MQGGKEDEMKRFLIGLIVLILALALPACGTTQQTIRFPDQSKYVEEQGKGRIYLIGRPFPFNLGCHYITVSVIADGQHVGLISGDGYLCWEREPGNSVVAAYVDQNQSTVSLSIESGKAYYVIAHVSPAWETVNVLVPGSGKAAVKLEVVNEGEGKKALLKCKAPNLK